MLTPSDQPKQVLESLGESPSGEFDAELLLEHVLGDPSVSQYSIRHRFENQETLSSYIRCQVLAGQQRIVLHLPFYPHFDSIPIVSAAIFDDHAGRARITDQQKFGARIEIALDQSPSVAQQILVEVIASAPVSTESH